MSTSDSVAVAGSLLASGRPEEAEAVLRRLRAAGDDSAATAYSLAMVLLRRDQLAEAEVLLRDVIAGSPDYVRAHHGLGQVLRARGERAGAVAAFERVLALDPGNARAGAALARLRAGAPAATDQGAAPAAATARPTTVSGMLEVLDDFDDELLRGELLTRLRRSLLSHTTLWFGVVVFGLAIARHRGALDPPVDEVEGEPVAPVPGVLPDVAAGGGPWWPTSWWPSSEVLAVVAFALVTTAALSAVLTRYDVRERAVDVSTGVLFRKHRTVWLWDTIEIDLQQNPVLSLTRTARLVLFSGASTITVGRKPRTFLIGTGPAERMALQRVDLQTRALHERRAMKKQWV